MSSANTRELNIIEENTIVEILEDNTKIELIDNSLGTVEINETPFGYTIPPYGLAGQMLAKLTDLTFDVGWINDPFQEVMRYIEETFSDSLFLILKNDRDPIITDDISKEIKLNSIWINIPEERFFICLDNEINSAVWMNLKNYYYDTIPDGVSGLFTGADKRKLDQVNLPLTFNQVESIREWNIEHQLNKYPLVVVTDFSGNLVEGHLQYLDENNLRLTFNAPFNGIATIV